MMALTPKPLELCTAAERASVEQFREYQALKERLGLGLDRTAYISAVGILWTVAALSITVAFGAIDLLTAPLALLATGLMVPMAAGMGIGRLVRLRLNPVWFRRAIAAGLLAAALRLVVSGLG